MKRKIWKWILGISIGMLVLLVLFTIALWVMANLSGILFYMLTMGNGDVQVGGITLAEFLSNFVGSLLFFIYLLDLAALLSSAVALIVIRKQDSV